MKINLKPAKAHCGDAVNQRKVAARPGTPADAL